MTTTENGQPICPSCNKGDSIALDDGQRLCLGCRNEWNPSNVPAAAPRASQAPEMGTEARGDVAEILHAPTVADVLGPTLDTLAAIDAANGSTDMEQDRGPEWTGQFVRNTINGIVGLVIEDKGETVEARDRGGNEYEWPRGLCEYLGEDEAVARDAETLVAPADTDPLYPVILAVAGLALTVGLEAVSDDPEQGFTHARIGWLPPPANQVPEVEQGLAYAIASLIRVFGLDKGEVEKLAANLLTGAEGGTQTEGQ